jgi:hypothetical protein
LSANRRDTIDLFVSQNQITSLENIIQFNSLQRLLMSFNQIRYIEDLFPLARLASLRELNLEGNPVCRLPLFTIHVFYLIPSLEVLNGRRVDTYSAFKIPRDKLGFYVDSEANLFRLLALGDLLVECFLARQKISSLGALFRDRFPPPTFVDFCHQIRQKCQQLQPQKYFQYLKELLLEKHSRIHDDTQGQDDLDEPTVARHFQVLNTLGQAADLANQLPLFEELTQLAAAFIQAKDRDKSRSRSRLSDRFSIASSVVRSRSSLASPKSPAPRKDKVTEDPPPQKPEKKPVPVALVSERDLRVVTEPAVPVFEEEFVPEVCVVLRPDLNLTAKSFRRWKLRARGGRRQIDSIQDFNQITDRVAVARQSLEKVAQARSLKEVSERRSLMQQVETRREVVDLSRERYHQLKREVEVIKRPRPANSFE